MGEPAGEPLNWPLNEHNYYSYGNNKDQLKNLQNYVAELEREKEILRKENKQLKEEIEGLKKENYMMKNHKHILEAQRIISNDKLLKFYTGFNSKKKYDNFEELMVGQAKRNYKKTLKTRNDNLKIELKTQLFITLIRLRVGFLEVDLAERFGISTSYISRIMIFWIDIMYIFFEQLPVWPSRSLVNEHMPDAFRRIYPSTRVILDATEMFIESPSDYIVQSSTYSVYKSHNTAKGVIGITPNGFVCFVSDLYPGRVSDKEIILRSNILDKLEEGDSVMADRGFIIADELRKKGCDLNIPPFLEGEQQLNPEKEVTTRDIAKVRIHVERAIR